MVDIEVNVMVESEYVLLVVVNEPLVRVCMTGQIEVVV